MSNYLMNKGLRILRKKKGVSLSIDKLYILFTCHLLSDEGVNITVTNIARKMKYVNRAKDLSCGNTHKAVRSLKEAGYLTHLNPNQQNGTRTFYYYAITPKALQLLADLEHIMRNARHAY
jgi:predicted transcriptional regulator